VLSTPHLTPSWSSARLRQAQGPSVALDTPEGRRARMGPGAMPRSRTQRLQSGRRFAKKAASASCMSAEHSRETHAAFSTRIVCSMVRFRVPYTMAPFF
jgi:hypothetical protein